MAEKLQTLLDINAIMKQRAEQRFAVIVNERRLIKTQMEGIKESTRYQKEALYLNGGLQPLASRVFTEWETAQDRKIESLKRKDKSLSEQQVPIRAELASIFVREKTLTERLRREQCALKLRVEKKQAENVQSAWLQNNL